MPFPARSSCGCREKARRVQDRLLLTLSGRHSNTWPQSAVRSRRAIMRAVPMRGSSPPKIWELDPLCWISCWAKIPRQQPRGALSFARSLGLLHTQTFWREPYTAANQASLPHDLKPIQKRWEQVKASAAQLGLPTPQGVDQDIAEIVKTLADTSAYIALSSGDPSVVNCKVINGQVSFLDFEEACLRPALVDAAVLHFLYPTGGPSWQVPRGMALQLESVYRAELARVCPAATEDASSYGGIAAAGAAWMILRMARLPLVDAGPDRDPWQLLPPDWSGPIPARSRRRQLVAIVETWIGLAGRANSLCALATWCESVTGALRDRWPEASEEFPFYPAFK